MSDGEKLYKTFVTKLSKILEEGETQVVGDGDEARTIQKEASAAYFTVALNFLKHVGETGTQAKPSIAGRIKELSLPFNQSGGDHPPH